MATKNPETKKAVSTKSGDKSITSPRKAVQSDERKKDDRQAAKKGGDEKRAKKATQSHPKKDEKLKIETEGNFEEVLTEHHQLKEKILLLKLKLQEIQSELSEASEEQDDSLFSSLASFIDVSTYLPNGATPEATPTAQEKTQATPTPNEKESTTNKEISVSAAFAPYPHPVFGVPLKTLVSDASPQHYFWRACVYYLLSPQALASEGVWRVPGEAEEIQHYKKCFDEGNEVNFKCSYFDVAGLFKQWIRELPEPLIPPLFDAQVPFLLDAHKGEDDPAGLLNDLKDLIQSLPKPNFAVVSLLGGLLAELAKHSEVNKMTEDNIIRCILPTVGCVPALFLWMIRCPEVIFGGTLVQDLSS